MCANVWVSIGSILTDKLHLLRAQSRLRGTWFRFHFGDETLLSEMNCCVIVARRIKKYNI